MKLIAPLTLLLGGLLAAADTPQTFTGVVTDTMCGAKHTMLKGRSDADCIKMCVRGSDTYALFDGKAVWRLSDQKLPAKFPAKRVKVTGVANEATKTIKVSSLEPED